MKRITLLLLLFVSTTFAQQYATKEDARRGIVSPATTNVTTTTNQTRNSQAVIYSESFDTDLGGWTTIDNDGDGNDWTQISIAGYEHSGAGFATSASWTQSAGPLTPDNWLVSPAIDLTTTTGTIFLDWFVRAQDQTWPSEVYRVLVSTSGTATTDFTEIYPDETVQAHGPDGNEYWKRTVDVSQFAGQTIHIAFQHHNCTDMFRLNIDDVSVYQNTVIDAGLTAIVAPNNDTSCGLTNAEDVTVTIFNYGGSPITDFDISYTVNGGAPVTETVSGVSIAPATSYDYTFNTQADLSTLGYYTINASINLANDADSSNNDVQTEVTNGDASLTVEVQTDNVGLQSWTLVNSNGDTVAQHGSYQWNITETTTVCLINNDCYTFHWNSDPSSSNVVTLTYNGTQVDQTTATGPYDVYSIGGNCSAVDIQLENVDFPSIAVVGDNVNIGGTVKNVGTDAITSYDVVYSVDGTASATYSVSGVNIATNQTANFVHNVPYVAVGGSHNVEVTISNVNGGTPTETNLGNNTLSQNLNVATGSTQKLPLYEEFTSSTCAPCASFNSNNFNPAFLNGNAGHFSLIKYQMNWPGAGDIYYTAEGGVRRDYYGVTGVPTLFLEGDSEHPNFFQNPNELQPSLDAAYAAPAFFEMAAEYSIDPTTHDVFVNINVTPYLSGTYTVHCAVVEKTTTGNIGSNGETEFHNVMMKMVPDAAGTQATFTAGTPATLNLSSSMNGTNVEEYSDLEVVVFIQDDSNKKVLQSAVAIETVGIDNNILNTVSIYPNPTNGLFTVTNAQDMKLSIIDLTGKVIYSNENLSNNQVIDLHNLTNGVYLARFTQDNKTGVKKIVIRK